MVTGSGGGLGEAASQLNMSLQGLSAGGGAVDKGGVQALVDSITRVSEIPLPLHE